MAPEVLKEPVVSGLGVQGSAPTPSSASGNRTQHEAKLVNAGATPSYGRLAQEAARVANNRRNFYGRKRLPGRLPNLASGFYKNSFRNFLSDSSSSSDSDSDDGGAVRRRALHHRKAVEAEEHARNLKGASAAEVSSPSTPSCDDESDPVTPRNLGSCSALSESSAASSNGSMPSLGPIEGTALKECGVPDWVAKAKVHSAYKRASQAARDLGGERGRELLELLESPSVSGMDDEQSPAIIEPRSPARLAAEMRRAAAEQEMARAAEKAELRRERRESLGQSQVDASTSLTLGVEAVASEATSTEMIVDRPHTAETAPMASPARATMAFLEAENAQLREQLSASKIANNSTETDRRRSPSASPARATMAFLEAENAQLREQLSASKIANNSMETDHRRSPNENEPPVQSRFIARNGDASPKRASSTPHAFTPTKRLGVSAEVSGSQGSPRTPTTNLADTSIVPTHVKPEFIPSADAPAPMPVPSKPADFAKPAQPQPSKSIQPSIILTWFIYY